MPGNMSVVKLLLGFLDLGEVALFYFENLTVDLELP